MGVADPYGIMGSQVLRNDVRGTMIDVEDSNLLGLFMRLKRVRSYLIKMEHSSDIFSSLRVLSMRGYTHSVENQVSGRVRGADGAAGRGEEDLRGEVGGLDRHHGSRHPRDG